MSVPSRSPTYFLDQLMEAHWSHNTVAMALNGGMISGITRSRPH